MAKQKKNFENKVLTIRLGLTAFLAAIFLLVFFLCGGTLLLFQKTGEVKCFSASDFEVHFIDVGQGDSAFIRFPDNTNLLIDAGPYNKQKDLCAYLNDLFNQESITHIDNFLLTHYDSDHVGGAEAIFQEFEVKCLYRPKVYSTYEVESFGNVEGYKTSSGKYYDNAIRSAYEENCTIRYSCSGICWGNDSFSVNFLSPEKDSYSNSNAYSPVVKITYLDKNFLFTGDAESVTENEVIENFSSELDVDVLKVGHHGAKTSTSQKFLNFTSPEIAVISVGKNNSYGHPTEEVLQRLRDSGCEIYQTSLFGSIAMTINDKGEIIIGGHNNAPIIDVTIVIVVFVLGVLIVWGVKPKQKKKRKREKST